MPCSPAARMQPDVAGRLRCRRAAADRGRRSTIAASETAAGRASRAGVAVQPFDNAAFEGACLGLRTRQSTVELGNCPPARQSTPASPRPTIRRGRAAAARRSRPYAGKVHRAPRSCGAAAALNARSSPSKREFDAGCAGALEMHRPCSIAGPPSPRQFFRPPGAEGGKGGEGGDLTGTTRQAVRPSASARWNSKPPTIRLAFFLSIQPSFDWLI